MIPTAYPSAGQLFAKSLAVFGQPMRQRQAIRAWRYYEGTVYDPQYGQSIAHPFTEWDETEKGRRPAVQPIPQNIIETGAQMLFSVPPRFTVGDPEAAADKPVKGESAAGGSVKDKQGGGIGEGQAPTLQELLDDILRMNELQQQYLPEARSAGVEGGAVFKFAWDPDDAKCPISIQTFSPWEVTFYRAEMNIRVVRSVRLQIKYLSPDDDTWYLYREDWDSERYWVYSKLKCEGDDDLGALKGMVNNQWPRTEHVNPFGVIPFTQVYNQRRKHDPDGRGDYWNENLYHLFDDYNLFCWLERSSNQTDGNPLFVIIGDATFDGTYSPAPGTALKIHGEGADAKYLTPENNMREWIAKSKNDIEAKIYDAVGYDKVDVEEITNKGNLTRAVWELMFAKSIKSTNEKRAHWGEGGLCVFFENLLEGLSRLPDAKRMYAALAAVKPDDHKSFDVACVWPDLFTVTQDELTMMINNAAASITNGFLTRERAVPIVAKGWGIEDVTALEKELEDAHEMMDTIDQAAADAAVNEAANAGKSGEGQNK